MTDREKVAWAEDVLRGEPREKTFTCEGETGHGRFNQKTILKLQFNPCAMPFYRHKYGEEEPTRANEACCGTSPRNTNGKCHSEALCAPVPSAVKSRCIKF
jgi:hypothetical protein